MAGLGKNGLGKHKNKTIGVIKITVGVIFLHKYNYFAII